MKSNGTFYHVVLKINLLNMAIYISAYYFLRHVQLPRYFNKKKWIAFGLSLLGTSLFFYTVWRVAGVLWTDAYFYPNRKMRFMTLVTYFTQTIQFYSPAMLLLMWEFYHERQQEKIRVEQLEKEKLAAELKFLKAQINPHFLFNTLNNLYSFVVTKSPKAPEMIMRLSKMLDYVLYQSQKTTVPLKEEINCIDNFLELEKIRYGKRLHVDYQTEGDLSLPISPLLLLSVVENAFKHGASGDIDEPKIKIKIHTSGSTVHCNVWNTKSQYNGELNDAYKDGIGLSNIKRQLKLIYPERHELNIENGEQAFNVRVRLAT